MPKKPRRPCSYPGCPNLCDGQYCEEHRKQARRQYDKYERSHPLCEMCLEQGKHTPVDEVHHVLPVSKGGTHARGNLMALCRSCHNKIHHELGDR